MLAMLQTTIGEIEVYDPYAVELPALWGPLLAWLIGMALFRFWDIGKWVRDQRKEGRDVRFFDYFRHYNVMTIVQMGLGVSLFFVWRKGVSFGLLGVDIEIPYVAQLAWFMGFFADTFSVHLMKIMRNLMNRAKGKAISPTYEKPPA